MLVSRKNRIRLLAILLSATAMSAGVANAQTAPWAQNNNALNDSNPFPSADAPAPTAAKPAKPAIPAAASPFSPAPVAPAATQAPAGRPTAAGTSLVSPSPDSQIRNSGNGRGLPVSSGQPPGMSRRQQMMQAQQPPAIDPNIPLGLTQEAWTHPKEHIGPGQTEPGVKPLPLNSSMIPTINLRQNALTIITFPPDVTITSIKTSSSIGFEPVVQNDNHSVVVLPKRVGIDGDMVIFTDDNKSHIFYLVTHPWNDPNIPDLSVPMGGAVAHSGRGGGYDGTGGSGGSGGGFAAGDSYAVQDDPNNNVNTPPKRRTEGAIDSPKYDDDTAARLSQRPRALATKPGQDYVATALTGNGRIRSDLTIKIPDPHDALIAPIAAWRDDHFMYLDFGPRSTTMTQWPVASLVIDGIESPVQTSVSGPNRSVLVIKAIGNVALRNGGHIVCITIPLVNNDPRNPALDEVYQNNRRPDQHPTDSYDPAATPPLGTTPAGTGDYLDPKTPEGRIVDHEKNPPGIIPGTTAKPLPIHVQTGPYDNAAAYALAQEIGNGYRNNPAASARVLQGPPSDSNGAATYYISITTRSGALAQSLCSTLSQYSHSCTLF